MPYLVTSCCIVGVHAAFGAALFSMWFYQEFKAAYDMNPGIALITYPIVFLLGIEGALEMFVALGLMAALFACAVCALSRYAESMLRIRWWLLALFLCCVFLCIPYLPLPWTDISSFLDEDSDLFFSGYPRILLALFFLVLWTVLLVSDARGRRCRGATEGGAGGRPRPR